jgi:hypothetical protein
VSAQFVGCLKPIVVTTETTWFVAFRLFTFRLSTLRLTIRLLPIFIVGKHPRSFVIVLILELQMWHFDCWKLTNLEIVSLH